MFLINGSILVLITVFCNNSELDCTDLCTSVIFMLDADSGRKLREIVLKDKQCSESLQEHRRNRDDCSDFISKAPPSSEDVFRTLTATESGLPSQFK